MITDMKTTRPYSMLNVAMFGVTLVMLAASPAVLAQKAPAFVPKDAPASTTGERPSTASQSLNVVVTVPPLRSLVESLLPKGSTVTMLMRPGRSEHGYEFTADDVARLAKADMVVLIGLGLEPRVEQALKRSKNDKQVVLNWGELESLKQTEDHDHDHDHDHGHACGVVDQHLWLDPELVERFVTKVSDAVKQSKADWSPETLKEIDEAKDNAIKEVRAVDEEYRTALAPLKGNPIICHHDAYSRLAARYDLKVVAAIKSGTGAEPTPKEISQIVKAIQKSKAKAIFIEPQFDPTFAKNIAKQANVNVAQLDPLGDGDWAGMMRKNLQSLKDNLGTKEK